jgi:hypothetical protein
MELNLDRPVTIGTLYTNSQVSDSHHYENTKVVECMHHIAQVLITLFVRYGEPSFL